MVCFLDPLMYEVWFISNSNQKMLAEAQLAHLRDHLEERRVSHTLVRLTRALDCLSIFTLPVELLVRLKRSDINFKSSITSK